MAATDATAIPIKNQAYRVTFAIYDNDGDTVTAAAALDSEVSKDGGTFADCTNEATEIATSSGVYYLDLTATEMNADTVAIIVKTTTTDAKTTVIVLYPAEPADIIVNVKKVNGTDQTAGDLAALITTVDTVVDAIEVDTQDIQSKIGTPSNLGSGATVAGNLTDIESQTDDIGAAGAGLTAVPWNAAWDAQVESEVTDALVALHLDHLVLASGSLAVGGGHTTTQVVSDNLPVASRLADFYNNCVMVFTSGPNAGTANKISDTQWDGFVHTLVFSAAGTAWPATPADGNTFVILAVNDEPMRGTNNAAVATQYTATRAGYLDLLNTNLNATVSSRSSHSAADVWAVGTRTLTSFGTLVTDIWAAGTRTLTSFGSLVADIWAALTSGLTTAGSIGKLLVDNINATISSRASQTSVDTIDDFVDTEVAAIKAKTDQLTFTVANKVDANATHVAGTLQTAGDIIGDTNDIQTKIGTPAGASVSADIAAVKAETASIQADTNSIETKVDTVDTVVDRIEVDTISIETKIDTLDTNVDTLVTNVAAILDDTGTSGVVLTAAERTAIATALLKIDMSTITGESARSPINALRTMRNRVTISGTTLTVYEEDDVTIAWTGTITTDASADPITAVDPA